VDFHALPFRGDVLLAARPVVYGLDLPQPRASRPAAPPGALLLADPAGDLPGARDEARTVADALRGRRSRWAIRRLVGPQATGEAVRRALPGTGLLHFAGHAVFDGWDSFLPLAAGSRLTLDDVLSLDPAPAWVVLSGCETAATAPYGGVETLGLSHVFLAAGSWGVIAAARPLPDQVAAELMPAFYRAWDSDTHPSEALRRAQLALRAADPGADWASFRAVVP
jgi:CHAT domain-containing protein